MVGRDEEHESDRPAERSDRAMAEVEEVLTGLDTVRTYCRGGAVRALGVTASGRYLAVISAGVEPPEGAGRALAVWESSEEEWRRWQR